MQLMVENEQENRRHMADALSQMAIAKEQGATDKQHVILSGMVDSLKAQQEHQHQVMQDMLKSQHEEKMADKEIIRDKASGTTTLRTKKKE
jgi:ABC-type phosphate transport system auxiliary subunit